MNITGTKEDSNTTNKVNKINSVDNPFELYEMLGAIVSSNPEEDVMQGKIVQHPKSNLKVPEQGESELDFSQQLEVANGMSIIVLEKVLVTTTSDVYSKKGFLLLYILAAYYFLDIKSLYCNQFNFFK